MVTLQAQLIVATDRLREGVVVAAELFAQLIEGVGLPCVLSLFNGSVDGELVRVEGDENHPATKGRLCVRCLTIRDYVYNPDRVLYPMKRAREDRGKNKWERSTWDEAYD
ncbi:MAG: hypothetical protein HUJ65_02990, partial [Oscillospiraceae bacterium]|nr:hypothetical protein [Oscillospiraceae bacterium]